MTEVETTTKRNYLIPLNLLKDRFGILGDKMTRVEMGQDNKYLRIETEEKTKNNNLNSYTV
jgi:hypothetical protein